MSPMFFVADDLRAGRLVSILQEFLQDEHAINAIYPHRQHVSAKVRSFIDLSIRYFREHPTWAEPRRKQEIECARSPSRFDAGMGEARAI